MLEFFSKLGLSSGGNSVLGIDIGSSAVKVVQLKNDKGVAVLEQYGSLAIGPYQNQEVGKAVSVDANIVVEVLKTLRKEAELTSNTAGIAIPFRSSFTSLMELPNLSDSKLAEIIPFEARKYIPTPIEEVSLDWFVVPDTLLQKEGPDAIVEQQETKKKEPTTKKALLAAIHNHDLENYKKIVEALELKPKFFEIEIFSTLRSVAIENRAPIMIIDIGASTTKFYLLEKGIVLRSYFINQGGQSMTHSIASAMGISFKEAEVIKREEGLVSEDIQVKESINVTLKEIFSEANHAVSDFQSRYGKDIVRIIFTGGGSTVKGLLATAKANLKANTELADPFKSVKNPIFLDEVLKSAGPEFAVAIGAAIRAFDK